MPQVTAGMLQQEARAAAHRYGIDPDLFERQMRQESGFAIDVALGTRLSSAGAGGVGQFMPDTWTAVINQHPELAQFGADPRPEGRFNPIANINAAAAHMSDLFHQFGNIRDALIAYNAGPGRVGQSLLPETQTYINNILGGEGVTHSPALDIQGAIFRDEFEQFIQSDGSLDTAELRATGWVETGQPGVWVNSITGKVLDFNDPFRTAPAGPPPDIGPIAADLEQQRIDLDEQLTQLELRIRDAHFERQDAIGAGNLDLAFQTERRIQQMQQQQFGLEQQRTLIDFQIQQQQLGLQERGQDITQRGQDIAAQLDFLQLQFQDLQNQRQDAIARGDQQLAAQIEQRMRFIAESGNAIAQGSQNVDIAGLDLQAQIAGGNQQLDLFGQQSGNVIAQGGQNLDAASLDLQAQIAGNNQQIDMFSQQWQAANAIGDLQGQQDAELRLRAAQQQQAALQQQSLMLESQRLGVQAQTSGGNIAANLAVTEQQRLSELQQLAANPRDFAQLQFALGSGESFIQDLLNGIAPGGQSVFGIGDTPLLGSGFDQLISQLGQRPAFDEALGIAQGLGGFQAPSTISMQDILGLGVLPGLQQLPQFPTAPTLQAPQLQDIPQLQFPDAPALQQPQLPDIPQIQFPDIPEFIFTQPPPIPSATATEVDPATAAALQAQIQAEGGSGVDFLRAMAELQGQLPGLGFTPPPPVAPTPPATPPQLPAVPGIPSGPGFQPPPPVPPQPATPPSQPVPSVPGAQISTTGSPAADQLLIDTATPGGDPTGSIDALMQLWREQGLIP